MDNQFALTTLATFQGSMLCRDGVISDLRFALHGGQRKPLDYNQVIYYVISVRNHCALGSNTTVRRHTGEVVAVVVQAVIRVIQ